MGHWVVNLESMIMINPKHSDPITLSDWPILKVFKILKGPLCGLTLGFFLDLNEWLEYTWTNYPMGFGFGWNWTRNLLCPNASLNVNACKKPGLERTVVTNWPEIDKNCDFPLIYVLFYVLAAIFTLYQILHIDLSESRLISVRSFPAD